MSHCLDTFSVIFVYLFVTPFTTCCHYLRQCVDNNYNHNNNNNDSQHMDPSDRHTITSNMDQLCGEIDLTDDLMNQLVNKNVFTKQMTDDFKEIADPSDRKRRFLHDLCRRGPDAYNLFAEVLYGLGQESAARTLRPTSFKLGLSQQQVIENITSTPIVEEMAFPTGMDDGDHAINRPTTQSTIEDQRGLKRVIECKSEMKGQNIYQMNSNPRGICLILNIHKYENNCYPERLGSEVEARRMTEVFTQLHFKVEVRQNESRKQMEETLKVFSKKYEMRKHDAFILVILSHGNSGYVLTADGASYHFNEIIERFNNENSPNLINKPKLFFFNCCRGDLVDNGPKFKDLDDAVSDAKSFDTRKVPLNGDMMLCYSTIDGYVSWRNEDTGTWFGQALCNSLIQFAHNTELHQILTYTSNLVNSKETYDGNQQVMEHTFRGWKKCFYFNPGITAADKPPED